MSCIDYSVFLNECAGDAADERAFFFLAEPGWRIRDLGGRHVVLRLIDARDYTPAFFRLVHDSGMMTYSTVRSRDHRILAFGTSFEDESRSVAALVGYDTTLDRRSFPLYRMVVANGLRAAMQRNRVLFLSTGAANFKLCRGSYEWLEYEAVYDRHLPRHKRLPWKAFGALLDAGTRNLNTSQI
ncbi:MAG TPA: hypothetical protein VFU02_02570 [Polyangiaceae bacterium]|nr:hypothetical protein [Polyangiaceae bacterium]